MMYFSMLLMHPTVRRQELTADVVCYRWQTLLVQAEVILIPRLTMKESGSVTSSWSLYHWVTTANSRHQVSEARIEWQNIALVLRWWWCGLQRWHKCIPSILAIRMPVCHVSWRNPASSGRVSLWRRGCHLWILQWWRFQLLLFCSRISSRNRGTLLATLRSKHSGGLVRILLPLWKWWCVYLSNLI